MFSQALLFILPIAVMAFSAKVLLDLTEKIYKYFALSAFAVGAFIFGIGLSLPGLLFGQLAVQKGDFRVLLGTSIGAMASSLFLIYGLSGLFGRLLILRQKILQQFYFQFGAVLLLGPILLVGYYHIVSGFVLIGFFVLYLWKMPYREKSGPAVSRPVTSGLWWKALVAFGALLAAEVVLLGRTQEMSEVSEIPIFVRSDLIMGLTSVFPLLLVALTAILTKKDTDLITGGVIGTNLFYGCFGIGLACFYNFDFKRDFFTEWIMLLLGALCLVLLVKIKRNFYRISSVIFLTFYLCLIFYWSAYGQDI